MAYGVPMQPDAPRPLLASGTPLPPPPPSFSASVPPPRPGRGPVWLAALVGIGVVVVTVFAAVVVWLVTEALNEANLFIPAWFAPAAAVVAGIVEWALVTLLVAVARRRGDRYPGALAAGRAWRAAVLAAVALGCVRATPLPQNEILLLLTAVVAAAAGWLIRRFNPPVEAQDGPRRLALFGVAGGLLMLIPWLAVGALGGLVETVAAVLAAAAVGYLTTGILTPAFFGAFDRTRRWQLTVGGLATGVALAPIAAALGGLALGLAELVTVPAVSFAAAALAGAGGHTGGVRIRNWRGPTGLGVLIALAVLGPIAFVDPEETSLVLGFDDVATWAARAAALGLVIALLLGLAYGLGLRPGAGERRVLPVVVAVVTLIAAGAVYAGVGQPGLYGEKLFVIMAEQADLSGLSTVADRPARLTQTYTRLVQTADRTQADLRQELDRFGISYTPYYLVNAILVDAGPALIPFLSGRSDVDRVLIDQHLRPLPVAAPDATGDQSTPGAAVQWNISAVAAPTVWREGDTGKGITIGSVDTGVDGTHPALKANFRGGSDSWYDPWNGSRTPTDHNGHGTHTTGTAVGGNGIGVAPGANWMGCVSLDRNYGSPSHYLDCLQFMLAPFPYGGNPLRDGRPARAPQIITNSWGCPTIEGCDFGALRPATDALTAAGIYVVVAAGNSGPSCGSVVDPPAPYPSVLTVGSIDIRGVMASSSSRGPTLDGRTKPDLVAPGVDVLSALPHNTYGVFSGTSMATPHVAGVVALMWSANPKLVGNIAATTKLLDQTVTPVRADAGLNDCGPHDATGAGEVNAAAAVKAARSFH